MLGQEGLKAEIKKGSIYVDNTNLEKEYINVTLGNTLKVYKFPKDREYLDVRMSSPTEEIFIPEEGYILEPNELYLGRTNEWTETYGFVPILSETDEIAATGTEIHVTAGFGDNGFEGTWTLEIVCAQRVKIYPNMRIGKIGYFPLIGESNMEYRGKYFRQVETTASKLNEEYKGVERVMKRKC